MRERHQVRGRTRETVSEREKTSEGETLSEWEREGMRKRTHERENE